MLPRNFLQFIPCVCCVVIALFMQCCGTAEEVLAKLPITTLKDEVISNSKVMLLGNDLDTTQRGRIILNGVWQFQGDKLDKSSEAGWQQILVPGSWKHFDGFPGFRQRQIQPTPYIRGFYRKTIEIPASWTQRSVFLNLSRVSTDARVFVNGTNCGDVPWSGGTVDITPALKNVKKVELLIIVAATKEPEKAWELLGRSDDLPLIAPLGDNSLQSKGLIGDVSLESRPKGAQISDVFVIPSVAEKALSCRLTIEGVSTAGPANLMLQVVNSEGEIEKAFSATVSLRAADKQEILVKGSWPTPKLWDVNRPYLYTLRATIDGNNIKDDYPQKFGFREFSIEGKRFLLNGVEIKLRPVSMVGHAFQECGGVPEHITGVVNGFKKAGFNCQELWPCQPERGQVDYFPWWYECADRQGWLVMGVPLSAESFLKDWQSNRSIYADQLRKWLPAQRNHPSIVMWSTIPNIKTHPQPTPLVIGRQLELKWPREKAAVDAVRMIEEASNRPAFCHMGYNMGSVFTLNQYLNFTPLQEREEFLSDWRRNGSMPYMAVEFGTPLDATVHRGRTDYGETMTTEPLMTEFSATYLGPKAYELESEAYRREIARLFIRDQKYQTWHLNPLLDFAPAFQQIQSLFIRNTWRSWRATGITGGVIPWANGYGWKEPGYGRNLQKESPVVDGKSGPAAARLDNKFLFYFQEAGGWIQSAAGDAIQEGNKDTLAWICGGSKPPTMNAQSPYVSDGFYSKDHHFYAGQSVEKQIAILNDSRSTLNYEFRWTVTVDGKTRVQGTGAGKIEPAARQFLPLNFSAPKVLSKSDATVSLRCKIGEEEHSDNFQISIYPRLVPGNTTVYVADPSGRTADMLKQIGLQVVPITGSQLPIASAGKLIVIGRESLSSGKVLLSDFKKHVASGGTLLCFAQQPQWLQDKVGFRVGRHVARRVFPTPNSLFGDLSNDDLRDWNGFSDLLSPYEESPLYKGHSAYGWRWGCRGGVSSSTMEKPHFGGWTPLLETEFDLAYSPLLENTYQKGRIIFCELDLEERINSEPMAGIICKRLVEYASSKNQRRVKSVSIIGNDREKSLLTNLGAHLQPLSDQTEVLIAGQDISSQALEVRKILAKGGTVFYLPRAQGDHNNVQIDTTGAFAGSLSVPGWKFCTGLSASDLRWRTYGRANLITGGAEIGAGGLLARRQSGPGTEIFCQIDPTSLPADSLTYFRFTRWRQTRSLSQLLHNIGVDFEADEQPFLTDKRVRFYHPDYIPPDDVHFALSDNPYRYYAW